METVGHSKIHVATLHSSKPKLKVLYVTLSMIMKTLSVAQFFFFPRFLKSNEFFFFKRNYTEKTKKNSSFSQRALHKMTKVLYKK
jgi:hypothetical protein